MTDCQRLAEYFVTAGAVVPLTPIDGQHGAKDIFDLAFQVDIVDRYPSSDYRDCKLPPQGLALFCLPEGARFTHNPPMPIFHSFATTIMSGERIYGYCLQFYEKAPINVIRQAQQAAIKNNLVPSPHSVSWNEEDIYDDDFGNDVDDQFVANVILHFEEKSASNVETSPNVPRVSTTRKRTVSDNSSNTNDSSSQGLGDVYIPKSICILSRWMFLNQFREYLTLLYRRSLTPGDLPIERYICNLMHEIPVPPRGLYMIRFFVGNSAITLSRPPINNPLQFTNFPFMKLFMFLDVGNVVSIFEHLIHEHQILLLSKQYSLLTVVSEALRSLLYPFEWQHIYIPLLPQPLLDFLNAPVPFLIGTLTSYVRDLKDLPPNLVVVDIDNNHVFGKVTAASIPKKERSKLMQALKHLDEWRERTCLKNSHVICRMDLAFDNAPTPELSSNLEKCGTDFGNSEESIRKSFLRVFLSLLKNYRNFMVEKSPLVEFTADYLIDVPKFLAEHHPLTHEFLLSLLNSQAFQVIFFM